MNRKLQIARCKARRLEVPAPLQGHDNYVRSLVDVTRCLTAFAPTAEKPGGNPGALISMSDKRMKNVLAALMQHAASDCQTCAIARKHGTLTLERRLIGELRRYEKSDHAKSASALTRIAVVLPTADGSSGEESGETLLLDGFWTIITGHYAPASSSVEADVAQSATA